MRAVLVGLVGAVLLGGAAQACNLEGAVLKSDDGRSFRVTKFESHFDRLKSPPVNDFRPDGYVRAVIEGGGQRYLIAQDYSGWGLPNNAARSYEYTDKGAGSINVAKRSPKAERTRVDGTFAFLTGPLEGVELTPVQCR